jgi:hypothetical protein
MKDILLTHHNRYPAMQIQDMVKLIYQNEFAGRHLIACPNRGRSQIEEECRTSRDAVAPVVLEEIGNALCRFHLSGINATGISPATLTRLFLNTADSVRGNIRRFEEKLQGFRECCRLQILPYDVNELDHYLEIYRQEGYPPVKHSEAYHKAYSPAYRIISMAYARCIEVFSRIDALLECKDSVCVAIDGPCGAGKSTLSSLIGGVYDCNVFRMDDFFLRPEQKTEARINEAGGNVDYERFHKEVVSRLTSVNGFSYCAYSCRTNSMSRPIRVKPKRLSIIEGAYSMHPTLAGYYDLRIFLDIDIAEQKRRILKRSGPGLYNRFVNEWIPSENRYFNVMQVAGRCDLYFHAEDMESGLPQTARSNRTQTENNE